MKQPIQEQEQLIELYAQIAAHTKPECGRCPVPYSCCMELHCEDAIKWAKQQWGVTLERTDGKDIRGWPLPLLGPNGCTAAPHLRPICAIHTCEVNSLGCKRGDLEWTQRYFELREQIEELEALDALEKLQKDL